MTAVGMRLNQTIAVRYEGVSAPHGSANAWNPGNKNPPRI